MGIHMIGARDGNQHMMAPLILGVGGERLSGRFEWCEEWLRR